MLDAAPVGRSWSPYLALLCCSACRRAALLYFPGAARTLAPPPPSSASRRSGSRSRTGDGVTLVAWIIRAPDPAAGRWLLICHGNARQHLRRRAAGPLRRAPGAGPQPARLRLPGIRRERAARRPRPGSMSDAEAAYGICANARRAAGPDRPVRPLAGLGGGGGARQPGARAGIVLDGALTSVTGTGAGDVSLRPGPLDRPRAGTRRSRRSAGSVMPKLFLHARADDVMPDRPRAAALRGRGAAQGVRRARRRAWRCVRGRFRGVLRRHRPLPGFAARGRPYRAEPSRGRRTRTAGGP